MSAFLTSSYALVIPLSHTRRLDVACLRPISSLPLFFPPIFILPPSSFTFQPLSIRPLHVVECEEGREGEGEEEAADE